MLKVYVALVVVPPLLLAAYLVFGEELFHLSAPRPFVPSVAAAKFLAALLAPVVVGVGGILRTIIQQSRSPRRRGRPRRPS